MGIDYRLGSTRQKSIRFSDGFTIIETVLVLAVTGMLVIGILIGSGVAINRQHYTDSVNSLEDLIQQQYSQSANVVNSRVAPTGCVDPSPDPLTACRGRSRDVIVGRSITVTPEGGVSTASKIVVTNILATPPADPHSVNTDSAIANINSYTLAESSEDVNTSETAWSTTVVDKGGAAAPLSAKILIIRAPDLGTTMTFIQKKTTGSLSTDLTDIVNDPTATHLVDLCVDPAGILLAGGKRSVRIDANAANANAVEVPVETANVCA